MADFRKSLEDAPENDDSASPVEDMSDSEEVEDDDSGSYTSITDDHVIL